MYVNVSLEDAQAIVRGVATLAEPDQRARIYDAVHTAQAQEDDQRLIRDMAYSMADVLRDYGNVIGSSHTDIAARNIIRALEATS